jgi:imidazolonepropionase-like amidohydrolase
MQRRLPTALPLATLISALLATPAAALAQAGAAPAPTRYVHCGKLVDTRAGKVLGTHTITVTGERIAAVSAGAPAADASPVIDLSAQTCLPGFIDLHVHLITEQNRDSYSEGFRMNPADFALRATRHARVTVEAGFTTVRDLGASDGLAISMRNAINQGWVVGPRVYAAGKSIATTGGHADPTNGINQRLAEAIGAPGPEEGVANGADAARAAVRQRYKEGADLVKITATGGVLSYAKSPDAPQFTIDEIKAIVETARDYGFHVAAHAHGAEGARRAVLGGVRTIEHGSFLTDEIFKLMRERETYLVPTLSAGAYVSERAQIDGWFPAIVRPKAIAVGTRIQQTFAAAYKAGVPFAFGTDAGVGPHGENAREFELMVAAGVPPMEALQSATVTAARVLDADADIGTLETGRYADIIAVPGDPAADIGLTRRVGFVMKGGAVIRATP